MNKQLFFALAMTAGLFASCSSDDVVSQAPRQVLDVDDSAPALIKLNISGPNGTTRGTGSVGWGENKWAGQSFNIFMFEKGSLNLAPVDRDADGNPITDESGNPMYIFDNAVLVTGSDPTTEPAAGSDVYTSEAQFMQPVVGGEPDATEVKYNYFPSDNRPYSFWAYRLDDAQKDENEDGIGDYKFTNDDGDVAEGDLRTQVRVPFEIDGSQDVMIAETQTATAATKLVAADAGLGKTITEEQAKEKIYSAYSARRGVNPQLVFSHKLSRLYFYVKAATKDVSDEGTNPTTMESDENGTEWYPGYKVTAVSVMSKSKGELIAAYKEDIPADAKRLVWTDADQKWSDPSSLAELQLRSRDEQPEAPDFVFYGPVTKSSALQTISLDDEAFAPGYSYNGARTISFDTPDDYSVYTSNVKNANGEPNAEPVKWSSLADGTSVYFALVPAGTHSNGEPWTKYVKISYAKDQLNSELTPVTPHWIIPDPVDPSTAWTSYDGVITKVHWVDPEDGDDLSSAIAIKPSAEVNDDYIQIVSTTDVTSTPVEGTIISQLKGGGTHYYKAKEVTYDTKDAPTVADKDELVALEGVADGAIYYVTSESKHYKYTKPAAADGEGVETPVGEALLVASEDEGYGYTVNFTFKRCKKHTDAFWKEEEGHTSINVKLKQTDGFVPGSEGAKAFQPGKAYKVTAIIYSDGEIKTDDVSIINWDSDTEEEMENGGIIDMN